LILIDAVDMFILSKLGPSNNRAEYNYTYIQNCRSVRSFQ